jgi:hypothetical protein
MMTRGGVKSVWEHGNSERIVGDQSISLVGQYNQGLHREDA